MAMIEQDKADAIERLLARVALKDQGALEALYRLTAGKMNGIALKIVHDRDLASDILQETYLQIWHKAGEYRRDLGEPFTWMTSLLRYRTLDRLRSEKREQRRRDHEEVKALFPETGGPTPLGTLLEGDLQSRLGLCLNQLEHANRSAILLAYYHGHSREDIADQLEQPINTIKSWLRRGLARLSQCLAQ